MRTDDGLTSSGDLARTISDLRGQSSGLASELSEAARQMRELDGGALRLSRSLSGSLRRAFDSAVFGGSQLGDVMRGLARSVAGQALDAALKPVQGALGQGVAGAVGALGGAVGSLFGFASGGAMSSGRVRAFARGGVVNGPTMFPMRNGVGLMGEAGPEAIMPLSRGPDGRLGVRAVSGGGGRSQVIVNIQTPDVEGFRRSRAQVAAQVARLAGLGERRL
ncbi:MAG: phage tail tape measure protein [Pseudomonadota bacterium]